MRTASNIHAEEGKTKDFIVNFALSTFEAKCEMEEKGEKAYLLHFKAIPSDPPLGKKRIKNIYWDPDTKEVVFDVED